MNIYEEGLKLIEEMFGNGKDNVISLATIAREPNFNGKPRPVVRSVDAYYEDGTFYQMCRKTPCFSYGDMVNNKNKRIDSLTISLVSNKNVQTFVDMSIEAGSELLSILLEKIRKLKQKAAA